MVLSFMLTAIIAYACGTFSEFENRLLFATLTSNFTLKYLESLVLESVYEYVVMQYKFFVHGYCINE